MYCILSFLLQVRTCTRTVQCSIYMYLYIYVYIVCKCLWVDVYSTVYIPGHQVQLMSLDIDQYVSYVLIG